MACVTGSWFTLKVNGAHHGFFNGKSGVRQGDPLSPYLFVLSMEILSRQLRTMCQPPNVSYHPKCSRIKLTHLVFADDLMIFTRGDLPSVQQAATILSSFSTWSGLTASLEKTEVYFGGVLPAVRDLILNAVGIKKGSFSFK
ncbi:putative mitochondrial protein AtMg01250 [Silene latifolia]|uniref:putative mitochondrial protein AtMg01250 n=1 Tax=Silene latifolia TaxID=37657 RepID=UPI003D7884EC